MCRGVCVCDRHLVPNKLYEYQAQIWGGGGGVTCSVSLSAKGSCDCGPSCLEIIHKLPLCSPGVILHLSDDHRYRTRGYLAWSPRPRAIDSCLVLLQIGRASCRERC